MGSCSIGIIAALLLMSHKDGWALTLSFIITFLTYEVTQQDMPWVDIQGVILGIPAGGLLIWTMGKIKQFLDERARGER